MKFKQMTVLTLTCLSVMACADSSVVGRLDAPPSSPIFKPAAQSVKLRHMTLSAVRAFTPEGEQISGATCVLDSPYYSITLTTPGVANLPGYGPQTPPLKVTCRTPDQTAIKEVRPTNSTRNIRAAIAGGAVGTGTSAGIAAGTFGSTAAQNEPGRANDRYVYNTIRVEFSK